MSGVFAVDVRDGEKAVGAGAGAPAAPVMSPRGLVDLRGQGGGPVLISYPAGAVVVVSGLPGSGKSTLLRRWSAVAPVVDPRASHVACEAVMPAWLPYAVYRPWARLRHFHRLYAEVRSGGPLLVHDCGSRTWMRRWLSWTAGRRGRELHVVLLDVGAAEALAGQRARARWASRRVFARHRRGLARLLETLRLDGQAAVREAASVVLLDHVSRERLSSVEFTPPPPPAPHTATEPRAVGPAADRAEAERRLPAEGERSPAL
ncbi:AAA family ATPase [Streptomyces sp. NPDC056492]|uniref:AAA family ATPase n=1 Tax=unclassified Streptomyces TaxID=2593676 RepID=UPI00369FAF90